MISCGIGSQRKIRQLRREGSDVGGVVEVLRVALFRNGERRLRQMRFHLEDGLCIFGGFRFRFSRELEDLDHMSHILLALLDGFGIGAGVVIALRQTKAACPIRGDERGRVRVVLRRAHAKESVNADRLQVSDKLRQIRFVLEFGNAIQLWLKGTNSLLIDRCHVHACCVFVADLLFIGRAVGGRLGRVLENAFELQTIPLFQLGEAAVGGLVGGKRILLEPVAAGELIEVVARIDRGIDERGIEDAQLMGGRKRARSSRGYSLLTQGRHRGENRQCNTADRAMAGAGRKGCKSNHAHDFSRVKAPSNIGAEGQLQ